MVAQGVSSLVVLVVDGESSFAEAVVDRVETTDWEFSAEAVTSTAAAVERFAEADVDGVVLGTGVDAPVDAVERITSGTDVPVVVLADGDAEGAVTAAHEADVAGVFPRVASGAGVEAVCERLATAAVGDDGMSGDYRAVFENVSDGLVVHDPDNGEILDVNERFCEMNGYDREALVGETLDLVTATEEGFEFDAATDRIEAAARGDPQLFEWRGKRNSGETYPVEVHLAVMTVAGEERVLASVRDITERKRREREFERIFDGVQDAIIVMDPETLDILQANDAYLEMVGYDDLAAVQDQGVEGLSLGGEGSTVAEARDIHRRVDETGEAEMVEWRGETSDGETLWLEVKVASAEIGGERVTVAIHRDVTERKRREREFEQIFDGVNDAIAVFDPETGDFTDVNRTYREMWGYDDLETIRDIGIEGLSVTEDGYSGERGHELIREVARTGDVRTVDWRGETRSGDRRWTEVTLAPADIGGEQRVLTILRDVTERKRRERIVQRLHESTEQLQTADSREAVCEATVAAAEDILDLSMPACWVPGEEAGDDDPPLRPIAATEAAWSMPGGPGTFDPGSFEYGVYEGDELVAYDPSEHSDETPLERAFLVPLGDHGLLGCGEPDAGSYDEVTLDAARILVRHATSALDRVERARELRASERRFRTIAERVDEVIYMATPDMQEVAYVSSGYEDVWGEPVGRLESEPFSFLDGIHPDDREEYRTGMERMRSDLAADEPDERYEFDYRVKRPDDEVRWVEARGYPLRDDDGEVHRLVGMIRDVTERERRERTLETFHEATRQLTAAESRASACSEAVRAAEKVLGFPLVSVHLYDEGTGRLDAVATTDRLGALDVDPPSFGPGESVAWQVYVDGESTTATDGATDVYGPGVSGPDIALPLGQHGVMLVGAPEASFDGGDVELAQILAATLEASLNHVADERALAEQAAELERERERAGRLQRLNDVIRDIEQATVERSARAGIETAVCERLADADAHDLVWIAEPVVGDDALVPRTSDGAMTAYLDALSLDAEAGAKGHPSVAAQRDGERQVVTNVATDVPTGGWRTTALQHGVQSVLAVPIRHDSTLHGVLVVESRSPDAFDDAIAEVLAELGRSIGYAVTMSEREQALESEGTTELEFAVDGEGLFMVRAATEAGGTLRLERTIRRTGGSFSAVYGVEGADPERLVERATAAASIEEARVVTADEDDDAGLVDVRAPTWFGSVFTDHGAIVQDASATPDGGTLVVQAPRGADVRELVEGFQERYPGAELVAQRQRERSVRSLFGLQDALREGLTDRQWEALATAYSAGYFAWPRETSGEGVAELLGVTQPTFNKHLRTAERTAFRMLLDREYPDKDG